MKKKIVIGLGTGRCGTVSLTHLLDSQESAYVTHERPFLLPWKFDETLAKNKIEQLTSATSSFTGDVAYYYLPYVEYMIESGIDVSFVCLQRNRFDTIRSYLRKTAGRNHWVDHDGKYWTRDPNYDKTYPSYLSSSKEQALGFYYDEYYSTAQKLQEKYPDKFKVFNTEDLNNEASVKEILDFIGVKADQQQIVAAIKKNVAGIDSRESS